MAETDCTEVGFAEKSKPAAGEKVRERQIFVYGGVLLKHTIGCSAIWTVMILFILVLVPCTAFAYNMPDLIQLTNSSKQMSRRFIFQEWQ